MGILLAPNPLKHCPCPGTPMGLGGHLKSFKTKKVMKPSTGTIKLEIESAQAKNCFQLYFKVAGCKCPLEFAIDICISDPPPKDLAAFVLSVLNSHPRLVANFAFTINATSATTATITWTGLIEGMVGSVMGNMPPETKGLIETINPTAVTHECEKYTCGEPVGLFSCDDYAYKFTDPKTLPSFIGVVSSTSNNGCGCDCACGCLRVLTCGETPLPFDPNLVSVMGVGSILYYNPITKYYTINLVAPTGFVPLTTNFKFTGCCECDPIHKKITLLGGC
jgi:hypothetical protein